MEYKCLVIDDDITIAENTAEYFNMFDIKTAFVTAYDDAVDFLEKNETNLVLLDINLGNNLLDMMPNHRSKSKNRQ